MITEKDLQEAIAECEGVKNPNANTCIKLAAFYTIKQHMFPDEELNHPVYSYSAGRMEDPVTYESETEFSRIIRGMDVNVVLSIMDELMSTIQAINPRLYDGVMRKIAE